MLATMPSSVEPFDRMLARKFLLDPIVLPLHDYRYAAVHTMYHLFNLTPYREHQPGAHQAWAMVTFQASQAPVVRAI